MAHPQISVRQVRQVRREGGHVIVSIVALESKAFMSAAKGGPDTLVRSGLHQF